MDLQNKVPYTFRVHVLLHDIFIILCHCTYASRYCNNSGIAVRCLLGEKIKIDVEELRSELTCTGPGVYIDTHMAFTKMTDK